MSDTPNIAADKAIFMPDKGTYQCTAQLPLPGIIILVHGVNSDGEWLEATEQGLCAGLNDRLGRGEEFMEIKGVEGGWMKEATFMPELTAQGFLNPDRTAKTFITDAPNYSPVIRFRWGFKAHDKELNDIGPNIWLNESHYWGGGPFANGCSSLPDLWTNGVDDTLFLWINVQHINPEAGRQVYTCPPRHYYAFAAKRLAELVRLIRQKQADIPITIVCHSQGNMIGLAAAFYGAQIGEVKDAKGRSAPAVADAYVLANPPYSVVDKLGTDNWTQLGNVNAKGESGRVTGAARITTLANFAGIIDRRKGQEQPAHYVDMLISNPRHQFDVVEDRKKYVNYGRVTLYCNPHDRVISAKPVQGMGWRGLSKGELHAVHKESGTNNFTIRVWAQGQAVGRQGEYQYWDGQAPFWNPPSKPAQFNLKEGLESGESIAGKVMTVLSAPLVALLIRIGKGAGVTDINAMPDKGWTVPITAPDLPAPHQPQSAYLGKASQEFDRAKDPDTAQLQRKAADAPARPDDPYDEFRPTGEQPGSNDWQDEARLKYEHHARMRLRHHRTLGGPGDVDKPAGQASPEWVEWSREEVMTYMKESLDQAATDHSTIMTCAANIEAVLAYDVAVGVSWLTPADWRELRVAADWRLWDGLKANHPHREFGTYFKTGHWTGDIPLHLHKDFNALKDPSVIPPGIIDERTVKPPRLSGAWS